jgi:hypothetical protein
MINLQIADPQISTKYCTPLPQTNPKSRLFKTIYYFVLILIVIYYISKEKKYIFRTCGSLSPQKSLDPHIASGNHEK